MFFSPISYDEPLFRPPSEAFSAIFQVTLGCSWNKCAFCEMYTSKKFKVKNIDKSIKEIEAISKIMPDTRKFFLADGNAMVLSANKLLTICESIRKSFKKVQRISAYALPSDINSKSISELKDLYNAGLKLLYIGIESGDNELLSLINKGETYNSSIDGLLKAKEVGIKSSVMILNGLGGRNYSEQHAINSAKVLNEAQPEYVSTLVLSLPYGLDHFKKRFLGDFNQLDKVGLIKELGVFINACELENSVYRSDHASNYLVLKGILSRDKQELLNRIENTIKNPQQANLREDWQRGL